MSDSVDIPATCGRNSVGRVPASQAHTTSEYNNDSVPDQSKIPSDPRQGESRRVEGSPHETGPQTGPLDIGAQLRAARNADGRSLRALGLDLGISHVYLSEIERGTRPFPVARREDFERELGLDLGPSLIRAGYIPEDIRKALCDPGFVARVRAMMADPWCPGCADYSRPGCYMCGGSGRWADIPGSFYAPRPSAPEADASGPDLPAEQAPTEDGCPMGAGRRS